jgi:NAD/NADP transhydrogenase beta subunit
LADEPGECGVSEPFDRAGWAKADHHHSVLRVERKVGIGRLSIGAGELRKFTQPGAAAPPLAMLTLAIVGALIGSISMTGSIIAWAKLDGRMDRRFTFGGQQVVNFAVLAAAVLAGLALVAWKVDASLVR